MVYGIEQFNPNYEAVRLQIFSEASSIVTANSELCTSIQNGINADDLNKLGEAIKDSYKRIALFTENNDERIYNQEVISGKLKNWLSQTKMIDKDEGIDPDCIFYTALMKECLNRNCIETSIQFQIGRLHPFLFVNHNGLHLRYQTSEMGRPLSEMVKFSREDELKDYNESQAMSFIDSMNVAKLVEISSNSHKFDQVDERFLLFSDKLREFYLIRSRLRGKTTEFAELNTQAESIIWQIHQTLSQSSLISPITLHCFTIFKGVDRYESFNRFLVRNPLIQS